MSGSRETRARETMARHGEALWLRGYVPGSSGNISMRIDDGILVTPTNSCLGQLDPARIAKIDATGRHVSGDKPSKEAFLHRAFYTRRDSSNAVVHLHSTHAVAVSCIHGLGDCDPLPPLTPYFVMKIGRLRVLPYYPPGSPDLAAAVEAVAAKHHAILLGNHGPVVAGSSVDAAVYAIEELEEAAKLYLLLGDRPVRELTSDAVAELTAKFES